MSYFGHFATLPYCKMKYSFWLQKWEKNEIGFHQADVHELLRHYWPSEKIQRRLPEKLCVFVPLCGKSLDMLWLWQQGCHVYGNELSEIAVQAFFNENELSFTVQAESSGKIYKHHKLQIYQRDFWSLHTKNLQDINIIYDRAALIALPDTMRQHYVQHLQYLVPQAAIFLISIEYEVGLFTGPPFCVSETEIRNLYANHYTITKLTENKSAVRNFPICEKLYWLERI